MALFLAGAYSQDSTAAKKPSSIPDKAQAYLVNPAAWVNDCYNSLNGIYLYQTEHVPDTIKMFNTFREHLVVLTILKKSFYGHTASLNIRTVHNMKMRVADILEDITKWQRKVHRDNELTVERANVVLQIRREIAGFRSHADSIFRSNYSDAVNRLAVRQQTSEAHILESLRKNTAIENKIVEINTQVYLFYSDIVHLLQARETGLATRELPPVWRSGPAAYEKGVGEVLLASFQQTLESVKYYGESALWRIIIFRALIVLLCLVPIKIFNDEQRRKKLLDHAEFTFLAKFPKTASVVMGMALSPFIFVHPPHAFMEFILIGLTFTVTMLTLQNYPKINKPLLLLVITAFMVLYLINFFVTPTFAGRLIYVLSILLLLPLYLIYKQVPAFELRHERAVRGMLLFLAVHLVAGWILVILGNYTLGRSVILSGYSLLIISMIMRIAIFTLLDYIEIIAYFFNKQVKMVKINSAFVRQKTKPLLIIAACLFLVVSYLFNMNIFDLVKSGISDFLFSTRRIGSATFTWMSIVLFFLSVYLAFVVATLIRHTFEPQHEQTVKNRSSLGSYLLLFRLLIICAGFTVGILASGLALTNFSIFIGALGVGIGFGLQNIVSNLISGLIIAFERPFVVGDVLEFGSETCKVKEISLRATMVSTGDGADILIPNNTLLSENLKNWTIANKQRFLEFKVLTMHDADPEKAIGVISTCLDNTASIVREKSVVLLYDITESGLIFSVKVLVTDLSNGSGIRSRLLSAIHAGFSAHKIRFPKKNNRADDF